MPPSYDEVVRFHGHSCPGLAIGYRMSCGALHALQTARAVDEEIVAIVESDSCGADALQCVTGCTLGKGNLIVRDWGKLAYTLYSRISRQGVRVTFNRTAVPEGLRDDRDAFVRWILAAPDDIVLCIRPVTVAEPEPARIHDSVVCADCGELVMETRARKYAGSFLCIPCAAQRSATHMPAP